MCIGREVDLALLSVADEEFWSDISLLTLDPTLPHLDDNVTAVGYPTGEASCDVLVCNARLLLERVWCV